VVSISVWENGSGTHRNIVPRGQQAAFRLRAGLSRRLIALTISWPDARESGRCESRSGERVIANARSEALRPRGNGHARQVRTSDCEPCLEEPIATIEREQAEQGRRVEQIQIADLGEVRPAEQSQGGPILGVREPVQERKEGV